MPVRLGRLRAYLLKPLLVDFNDGQAERGRRRAEEPLFRRIRAGLESYIDSDF